MTEYAWEITCLLIAVIALVQERRFTRIQEDLTRIRNTTNALYWDFLRKANE